MIIRELLHDAAREIVEGRTKLPTVRTVPVQEFRARHAMLTQPQPLRLTDLAAFNLAAQQPVTQPSLA